MGAVNRVSIENLKWFLMFDVVAGAARTNRRVAGEAQEMETSRQGLCQAAQVHRRLV